MTSKLFYRTTYADHQAQAANFKQSHFIPCDPTVTTFLPATPIVVHVEADEGTHLALENNPAFHTMALLVSGSTLCALCVTALAAYGVTTGDTMWAAGKKLAAIHPELRPSRF
jgi:hypothetical protein